MVSGLIMLAAAQAAAPAANAPASEPPAAVAPDQPASGCKTPEPKADTREILVCAPRQQGYRIDPDILEAQRRKKNRGRPRPPERLADNSCKTVGPAGCIEGPGINVLAAAATAATMVSRAAKGENVGGMFVTDPQPDEYQLYLQAKRRREAREEEQAARARAQAVKAEVTGN